MNRQHQILLHLPDPRLTPGDALSLTKEQVCSPGHAKKTRNVDDSLKKRVFARYSITAPQPGEYEIDHLISLELGGSNDITNLWPQPYAGGWNAHLKDKLENKLHQLVCSGHLDLKEAQHAIATNWLSAYQKYVVGN